MPLHPLILRAQKRIYSPSDLHYKNVIHDHIAEPCRLFFCSLNVPPSFRMSSNSSRLDTLSVYLGCSRWCTPLPPVDIQSVAAVAPLVPQTQVFPLSPLATRHLICLLLHPIRDLLLILRCLADTSRRLSLFFPALSISPHSFRTTSNSSRPDSSSVSIRVSEEDMAYYMYSFNTLRSRTAILGYSWSIARLSALCLQWY